MASDKTFVDYVVEQIRCPGIERSVRKMFGEYLVYLNGKPAVLVCDNRAFVKIADWTTALLPRGETGFPYDGARKHYVLDVDDSDLVSAVAAAIVENAPPPKLRKKKE